jgi:hypothetical protein
MRCVRSPVVVATVVASLSGCATSRLLGEQASAERLDQPPPTSTTLVEPSPFTVGDEIETSSGGTARVYSYAQPFKAPEPQLVAAPGKVLAVIDVEACAGPGGVLRVSPMDFELELADGSVREADQAVRLPALRRVELAAAGECTRGFVTFQVPWDERPVAVEATLDPLARWAIS